MTPGFRPQERRPSRPSRVRSCRARRGGRMCRSCGCTIETTSPSAIVLPTSARIKEYRGGAWPIAAGSTRVTCSNRVAEISRLVASNTAKRKIIVCIGSPFICDIRAPSVLGATTVRTCVAGRDRRSRPGQCGGLSADSRQRADVGRRPCARLLAEKSSPRPTTWGRQSTAFSRTPSNYYVLGYWPVAESGAPHRIQVKVRAKGAKVHARTMR